MVRKGRFPNLRGGLQGGVGQMRCRKALFESVVGEYRDDRRPAPVRGHDSGAPARTAFYMQLKRIGLSAYQRRAHVGNRSPASLFSAATSVSSLYRQICFACGDNTVPSAGPEPPRLSRHHSCSRPPLRTWPGQKYNLALGRPSHFV